MDKPYEIIHKLPNGYVIGVTPLPPYYLDVIKDAYPYKEHPKRRVRLIGGDEIDWHYEPPKEEPPKDAVEDYQLYHTWHSVEAYNEEIDVLRGRARLDMLYATCVNIKDGPKSVDDEDWAENVEAAIVLAGRSSWRVPKHPGARKIIFVKTQVVTDDSIHELVMGSAIYAEVEEQGVLHALQNFRDNLG